jgi:pyruvate/2-oxoglutarate dehydrogenase complex dihydrolipoamide dehydrogenase (E3) component
MANYDLIVIGAGPAGYVAAIKAAQLGKKVACVEKERGGGTCNNWGCIPTKALLKNAELFHTMKHRAAEFGFKIAGLEYDWAAIIKRSRVVSDKGAAGVDYLFKKNKIDSIKGEASLDKAGEVKVKGADGKEETHTAKNILIATGCVSRPLPGLEFNGKTVIEGSARTSGAAEEHCDHRRGCDRRGVRVFFQCVRDEGHSRRDAAEFAPGRGYRGVAGAREVVREAGHHVAARAQDGEDRSG